MVIVRSVVPMPIGHRTVVATIVMVVVITIDPMTHHSNWNVVYIYNVIVVVVVRTSIMIARLGNRGS